jgi:hypothetical protein
MKLHKLKKEIKDNIYEILSEESVNEKRTVYKSGEYEKINSALDDIMENLYVFNDDDSNQIVNYVSNIKDLVRKNGIETIDVQLKEEDPQVKKINDKIQKDPEFLKKTKEAMAKAEKGNSTDLAMLMGGFGKMFESEDEDREPTKAELAKEKVKTVSKFKIPTNQFEDFKSKLKTLVTKVKAMDKGVEKDKKMAALKQFIKKPELIKAFKERDVKIDTGGLVG